MALEPLLSGWDHPDVDLGLSRILLELHPNSLVCSLIGCHGQDVDRGLSKILPNLGASLLTCPLVGSLLVPDLWIHSHSSGTPCICPRMCRCGSGT